MRTATGVRLALAVAVALPLWAADAQAQYASNAAYPQYTSEELENLLAPVALYPDPILAQVLVAASYPDEVALAADHVRMYGESYIDDQPWDISVKALARYAPVLNMMADRPDWTAALGQAYADQPQDVMAAVQSLRAMARAQGNLVTTSEQEVVVEDRYIRILPARPRVVYVPVYDPLVVYSRPIVHLGVYGGGWSFGIGFPIGVWLTYDLDWPHRYVYYHGWDTHRYRGGWMYRSRPYIVINNIYIRPYPTVVVVNRRISDYYIDYGRFDRYNYVHRRVTWDRHRNYYGDRRYADGPSWNRDGRPGRASGGTVRTPSWDRDRRTPPDGNDRRAVPRGSDSRYGPNGPTSGQRQAVPPTRTQTEQRQPIRSQPERTQIQRAQPQRAQPRQSESRAVPPARTQTERRQPIRSQPERTQIQRAQPQRPQVQRSQPQRAQPRSQPQRTQPQSRSQPQQRAQPQRSGTSRASSPPGRSGSSRARPRGSSKGSGTGDPS